MFLPAKQLAVPLLMRRVVAFAMIALCAPSIPTLLIAHEAHLGDSLSTDQVITRLQQGNQRRAEDLKHYSGIRTYHIEYQGLGSLSADMTVRVQYDSPATKQFEILSQHGSKLLIDKVLKKLVDAEKEAMDPATQRKTALNLENYEFETLGNENAQGRHCYVLAVRPHINTKFLYKGKVWVDNQDFSVVRIEAQPAKNPSFWIRNTNVHQEYMKVGEFWLPALNRSVSTIKIGGSATLTINYGNYAIQLPPSRH